MFADELDTFLLDTFLFLRSWTLYTVYNGVKSPFIGIDASVVQGSVIGPGSYSVVASDLRPSTEGNDIVKFADDFDLIVPASNVDSRTIELQNIEDWAVRNNLQLNRKKSQEIVFFKPYTRRANIPVIPEIPGVPRVNRIRLLGVVLADNFSMEDHIASVLSSSASALYALKILRAHGMDRDCIPAEGLPGNSNRKVNVRVPSMVGLHHRDSARATWILPTPKCEGWFLLDWITRLCIPLWSSGCIFSSESGSNPGHLLRSLLPPPIVDKCYNMRTRKHKYSLPLT